MNVSSKATREADITREPGSELFSKTREELDFWINCVGAPLVVVDKQALVMRSANRNASTFFGIDADAFAGASVELLVGSEATQMLGQIWSNAPVGAPGEPFLVRAVIDQQERLLMVQVTKLMVEGEAVRLFTFTDAPPQGSVALAGWQENIIAMLNWVPFGFEISSTEDQIQFANSHFCELFGYSPDEIESIDDWWRLAYPDPDYREFAKSQWETSIAAARAEDREMTPFDLEVAVKGGGRRTIQFRHRTIGNFNVNLYLDVTKERAYARELKTLAETDPLTGAMNRRRFFEEAERIYAADSLSSVSGAVLMLDIDHFKTINDTHGHGAGDLVLSEFTRRCRNAIRPDDLLVRLGGEEFAILLKGATPSVARDIGERLLAEVNCVPFEIGDVQLQVTVSVGGAMRASDEATVEATVSRADKALYVAKNAGRNRLVI
jgi:diguanylate cyclase (GGDEF)-like protein